MQSERAVDEQTGRKFLLDYADTASQLTFVLNLHGGGSSGPWQRLYFPAHDYADAYGLVIAAPTAATRQPASRWVDEADDDHLVNVVEAVVARFDPDRIRAFWLVGHSQGGFTALRLLRTPFFADRVDGWLSLSSVRLGRATFAEDFGPPRTAEQQAAMAGMRARRAGQRFEMPDADFSFVFAVGEHEIAALPETSPWAERYGAGERVRLPDVVDDQPGQVHDSRWEGRYKKSWGREPRPGVAEVYVYPDARDGRVIADVVRRDKGHTEGLEPRIAEALLKMMVAAPGGKLRALG